MSWTLHVLFNMWITGAVIWLTVMVSGAAISTVTGKISLTGYDRWGTRIKFTLELLQASLGQVLLWPISIGLLVAKFWDADLDKLKQIATDAEVHGKVVSFPPQDERSRAQQTDLYYRLQAELTASLGTPALSLFYPLLLLAWQAFREGFEHEIPVGSVEGSVHDHFLAVASNVTKVRSD